MMAALFLICALLAGCGILERFGFGKSGQAETVAETASIFENAGSAQQEDAAAGGSDGFHDPHASGRPVPDPGTGEADVAVSEAAETEELAKELATPIQETEAEGPGGSPKAELGKTGQIGGKSSTGIGPGGAASSGYNQGGAPSVIGPGGITDKTELAEAPGPGSGGNSIGPGPGGNTGVIVGAGPGDSSKSTENAVSEAPPAAEGGSAAASASAAEAEAAAASAAQAQAIPPAVQEAPPQAKEGAAGGSGSGSTAQAAAVQGSSAQGSTSLGSSGSGSTAQGSSAQSDTSQSGTSQGSSGSSGTGTGGAEDEISEKVSWKLCRIEGEQIVISGSVEGDQAAADTKIAKENKYYLFELQPYEDSIEGHRYIQSISKDAKELAFRLDLTDGSESERVYNKYVAGVWDGGKYRAISEPVYITNPEAAAANQEPYAEPLSKKGLLVEHSMIEDAFYIGVSNVIVNIPFNTLFGEGIDYQYGGETYHFSSSVVAIYDNTISAFSNRNMNVNVVLLNGYNAKTPDFFYPGTKKTSRANYYHFNAATEAGYKDIRAIMSFLATRYSGDDPNHGRVQNWIVGNEINNQYWNYIGPMEIEKYVAEFERTFRVFYTAIRSSCANDRVFFSIDHNWNREADGSLRYNGREVLDLFADKVNQHGNIDWGLAYHPYSEPMTEPEFWDDYTTGQVTASQSTPVINFANIGILTQFLEQDKLRDRSGRVRHIILSEEGFTSKSKTRGNVDEIQAAAFAYAYYIADSNPYIDSFILSRQVDAPSELKDSLAFGLWTTNSTSDGNIVPAQRKKLWQVFKDIDRPKSTLETTEFAKEILGIEKWSDIIPKFRWSDRE